MVPGTFDGNGAISPSPNIMQLIAALLGGQGQGQAPPGFQLGPGQPVPNGQAALQNLLQYFSHEGPRPAQHIGPMPIQRNGPAPVLRTDQGGDALRGNPGATGGRGGRFVWGDRTWGPNDFNVFSQYLRSRGVDMGQWARAHPTAFASFNIDPNISRLIQTTGLTAQGGMAHA